MVNFDQSLRIALAHDSFTQMGGAERVVEALHELFPQAPVFTTVFDEKYRKMYPEWGIRTSWLQKVYNFHPRFKHLLPLIPAAVGSLNFAGYHAVVSSSSGFVKNIRLPKNCIHINYCNTPARFLWTDKDYLNQETPRGLRLFARLFLNWMKRWDLKGSKRVNYFIANSKEVQSRIQSVYQRTSTVIYPPIDVGFWKPTTAKKDYFLMAGRLQPHKKNVLMLEVFNALGLPLHVVGTGRQEQYLRSIAKPNIEFLGRISDEQLRGEYSGALGFIYPQLEDFGLMPLEAAACGTATLAYGKGGALETVVPGVTGELFENYDKEKIKQLILNWNPGKFKADALRSQAEKFSKEEFEERIYELIYKVLNK